jgi:hypothetical protein
MEVSITILTYIHFMLFNRKLSKNNEIKSNFCQISDKRGLAVWIWRGL